MHAIPPRLPGREIDPSGKYRCPLCNVQSAGAIPDIGWVKCPMIDNQPICLGSCIDHQGAARAENFATHPDHWLFDTLSVQSGTSADRLRWKCLRHQLAIVDQQLEEQTDDPEDLQELKAEVVERLENLTARMQAS